MEDGVGGIVCVQVFIAQGFRGGRGGKEGFVSFNESSVNGKKWCRGVRM